MSRTPEDVAREWLSTDGRLDPASSSAVDSLANLILGERKLAWIANSEAQQRFRDDGDREAFQHARRAAVEGDTAETEAG